MVLQKDKDYYIFKFFIIKRVQAINVEIPLSYKISQETIDKATLAFDKKHLSF